MDASRLAHLILRSPDPLGELADEDRANRVSSAELIAWHGQIVRSMPTVAELGERLQELATALHAAGPP